MLTFVKIIKWFEFLSLVYTLYIQEDTEMQFNVIDSKMKEIYFNPTIVEDKTETLNFNHIFWNTMNVIANQNIAIQQICFA